MADHRLGALLLKAHILSPAQLQEAEAEQIRTGVRLGQIVVDRGWVRERSFYDALAKAARLRRLEMQSVRTDRRAIHPVDSIWALDHGMVPLFIDTAQRTMEVAVTDPTLREPLVELEQKTGLAVIPLLGSEAEIGQLIRHQFFEEPLERPSTRAPSDAHLASEGPTEGRPAQRVTGAPVLRSPHESRAPSPQPQWGSPPTNPGQPPPRWGTPTTNANQTASWGAPATNPGMSSQDAELMRQLRPVFEGHQENARILQAVFELCVRRGVITREEYLRRLAAAGD